MSVHCVTSACKAYMTVQSFLLALVFGLPWLRSTFSSVKFEPSGLPSTYRRLNPLAQCRSPFGFEALKASKKTWPKCESQRLQMISRPPKSLFVPTWQPPASLE